MPEVIRQEVSKDAGTVTGRRGQSARNEAEPAHDHAISTHSIHSKTFRLGFQRAFQEDVREKQEQEDDQTRRNPNRYGCEYSSWLCVLRSGAASYLLALLPLSPTRPNTLSWLLLSSARLSRSSAKRPSTPGHKCCADPLGKEDLVLGCWDTLPYQYILLLIEYVRPLQPHAHAHAMLCIHKPSH